MEGPAPPHPERTPHDPRGRTPPNTRRRSTNQTPYGSHRHTPTGHREPHRGWRAHLDGENGLHPRRKPLGTPPRSPPPRPHRQPTAPATTRATSQAAEEDEARPQHPELGTETPRGHRITAQAPREGTPTNIYRTHQPEQHTETPAARTQRATHT